MTKQAVRFSIVIPCYNEERYIADTIRSLRAQTFAGEYEIIVVDNNCSDATAEVAQSLGARVVKEPNRGICWARQRGTAVARGEIIISTDADTTFSPNWLATIDAAFATQPGIVAVAGACRYKDGPVWGKIYPHILFGGVDVIYRLTGQAYYATATNIAFKKRYWESYDTRITYGGDEGALLRDLGRHGKVAFDNSNPTYTSGRRLTRGYFYNMFVMLIGYYFLAPRLNRLIGKNIFGTAPAYRDSKRPNLRYLQTATVGLALVALLFLPGGRRHSIYHAAARAADLMSDTFKDQKIR